MGVHGLWELLAPVGRRVSVESLGSRKLAIDASIWIIQFMKAMRDDRGDMIRNAHLLGFFRRICKLLFLRIKPVFVFDGGTPALKRRTVIARRRQREQAQSRIRKTAEKLLLNHLRTRKLDEIAGKGGTQTNSTAKVKTNDKSKDVSTFNDGMNGSGDFPSVDAAHGDLHNQGSGEALQEDEVQVMNNWNEIETEHLNEEDEEDEEEELVYLPSADGKMDPAVLASLPASMQLDLLVQMREQLVAENRHKFQKVAKAPSSFSQLQIEAYLKTVAFRRGINEAQKAAAGQGVGGVPSTRIASETNREFIFSTSYQGDKTALTGEGGGNPGLKPPEPKVQPPAVSTSTLLSTNFRSLEGTLSTELDEAEKPDSSVQTYVDEKGRTRVSRVRGMGVRMTRDLQWNLYLMKDVEKRHARGENKDDDVSAYAESLVNNGDGEQFQRLMIGDNASVSETLSGVPAKQNSEPVQSLEANQSMHEGGLYNDSTVGGGQKAAVNPAVMSQVSSIQITFNSNEDVEDEDLDLFQNLVADEAGAPLDKPQELKPSSGPAGENDDDDCEWEDGDCQGAKEVDLGLKGSNAVEELDQQNRSHAEPDNHTRTGNDLSYAGDSDAELALAIQESLAEHDRFKSSQPGVYPDSEDTGLSDDSDTGDSGESEVEWEDGSGAVAVPAVGYTVTGLALTQEELELQEATRRSLNDVASWRAPVRPLPQLVIREPVEGVAKMLSGSVPRVVEQEAVTTIDRNIQMDSEEARIARERVRKGKAVADEAMVLPPVGVLRSTVSQVGLEAEVGSFQEKVDGRSDVQAQPQGLPMLDTRLVAPIGAGKEDVQGQNLLHDHEDKNVFHLNGSELNDVDTVPAYNHVGNTEVGLDLVKQNLKPVLSETKNSAEPTIDTGTEVSQFLETKRVEKPGIVETPEMPEEVKLVPGTMEKGAVVANPNFVKPSSEIKDNGVPMEDMLKDAEEMDVAKEREEMLQHEAALLAEREALARDEADLQAALEKEQQELREGIEKERELLREEEAELREMQKKNERNADSVTSEMFAECQELLQMFGIPYVIAPMEAEAQCAFLDAEKLVDGVVTDDVDVFLFGGRNVYKNIFDDRKYVETYYMKDVETDLGLTRDKLIHMALLLGSDYTEGISGIGIVNAIEVVNAFDGEDGLKRFKEMVESIDLSLLGLEGRGSKRKGSQGKAKGAGDKGKKGGTDDAVEKDDTNEGSGNGDGPGDTEASLRQEAFMENHRAVSKNWKIPESFPSGAVVAEYKGPRVDKSKQSFSWGRPDLEALRKFCYERFSWPKDKADELLLSVLKEYDRQEVDFVN
ncbi:hypothetical protein KC19_3G132700 [Ceratodon purpureus]|uniref:DNA repair protein UVH3 n=1 Tax=Ceratodon purpureus TaxID=3225 RepID=A0A8T0II04_CERPU|nr:hypothetical protein KC19_3G132700 [Ceratodon purpureus]